MKNSNSQPNLFKISNLQFFMLIIACTTPMGHFVYIHLAFILTGRDTWLALFGGALLGVFVIFMQMKLVTRQANQTLIEQTIHVFGPWFGRLIGSLYVLFFLLTAAITLRLLTDFIGIVLPRTPPELISLGVLVLCGWLVYAGLEPLARTSQALLPLLMLLGITASVLTVKDKEPVHLLPIMENGWLPIWRGALIFLMMFAEWIGFTMMANNTNNAKRVPKQALLTLAILTAMFIGPVTGPIMVFGDHLARATSYPTYLEIVNIDIADFLQNLDTIGVFLWTLGAFLRISSSLYCASRGFVDLVGTKKQALFVFPACLLIDAINISLKQIYSQWEMFDFIISDYLVIVLFCGIVLPLLTWIAVFLRGKKQQASRANS